MKDEQWAFKAIFQKAMVRLGKIVEFQYNDEHLGNINDLITFLDRLYDEGVLKVYALLPDNHSFRLWTFVALNPGNDKIKVAKTVEDKIFFLLCLWYFGSRKLQLDAANNIWHTSARKLLTFFSADKNTAQWPDCKKCFETLYKAFDTPAFYGREVDKLNEKQKDELVRSRFAAVFEAGLPPFPHPKGLSPERSEPTSVVEENELDE